MQTVGIVGLGALGVLFGQRLLENGADVRVIADEARAERYQKQGVICNGTPVNFRYETPEAAKPVDLMIFATKESGLRGAMETTSGLLKRWRGIMPGVIRREADCTINGK